MNYFLLSCILFFCLLGKAQPTGISRALNQIEASTNYEKNSSDLETILKNKQAINTDLLKAQTLLITNYINLFQYDKAAEFCQKEILIAKKNKLPLHEATLYRYLGNVYYHLKQIDKSELYWKQCLQIAEERQYYDLLKRCNHNIGVIAFETESNYKKAEIYFLKAIEYGQKTVSTKQENSGNSYRLLASTYDVTGRYKQADSLFTITTHIYNKYKDSAGLAEALTFHARLYLSMQQYEKALELSQQSISISQLIKNDDYLQTALSIYVQIQLKLENFKEAFIAEKNMLDIEVSKHSKNQKQAIAESEAKFKVAELKNKQELAELQAKQNTYKYSIIFIAVFLISLGLMIFMYQKRIAKKEQQLKLKNLSDVYDAEEKERSRIAKDLHDNMGAYTTSILAQIDMLEHSEDAIKSYKLNDLRNDAEFIMSTLRETIWILKTKTITVNQFFDLVRIYADKHLIKNVGLNVTYKDDISNIKHISPTVSLNLYRIVQEIIQNIIKHAKAKRVQIWFSSHEKIRIDIMDDGVGFNLETLSHKSGLDNMLFRAKEINYTMIVYSERLRGTKIILEEIKI